MSTVKANDLMKVDGGIPTVKGQRLIPAAWVNFNGTSTVAIGDSENVSSITDNGTGRYAVNFITAMVSINYSACINVGQGGNKAAMCNTLLTTSVGAFTQQMTTATYTDYDTVMLIVMGGQA